MDPRSTLYAVAADHRLDAAGTRRLIALAELDREPPGLAHRLPVWIGVLAATLAGLGLVFWVAANWDTLGHLGQLALIQGLVLAACVGALLLRRARPIVALLALIAIGALLALLGQTYQTGADPWQLFAWWTLLTVPLALAVRSDIVWAPWALVAMTAVALWSQTHGGIPWDRPDADLAAFLLAWLAAALVTAWLSPALSRLTGAGLWSMRTAALLAVTLVTLSASFGLIVESGFGQFWIGLGALTVAAVVLALPRSFEIGSLSAVALGMDTLIVVGLGRWLLDDYWGVPDPIGRLLLLGFIAAGTVAGTVAVIVRLARIRSEAQA